MVRRVGTGCVECESAATNVSSLRKFSKKPALQSHSVQCLHARGAVHSHSKRSHSNAVSQSGRVRRTKPLGQLVARSVSGRLDHQFEPSFLFLVGRLVGVKMGSGRPPTPIRLWAGEPVAQLDAGARPDPLTLVFFRSVGPNRRSGQTSPT